MRPVEPYKLRARPRVRTPVGRPARLTRAIDARRSLTANPDASPLSEAEVRRRSNQRFKYLTSSHD